MDIDLNQIANLFFSVAPFAAAFFIYLHKLDNKISVLKNDVEWLKLKACQRRQVDFKNLIDEPE